MNCVVDKNPSNVWGFTPLHIAARKGHYSVCQAIINQVEVKNPANVHTGYTPLHWAAQNGHLEICELIVANVSDINPVNIFGDTPIDIAKHSGYINILQLLDHRNSNTKYIEK